MRGGGTGTSWKGCGGHAMTTLVRKRERQPRAEDVCWLNCHWSTSGPQAGASLTTSSTARRHDGQWHHSCLGARHVLGGKGPHTIDPTGAPDLAGLAELGGPTSAI